MKGVHACDFVLVALDPAGLRDTVLYFLCLVIVGLAFLPLKKRKPVAKVVDPLDQPLWLWNDKDSLTVRDLLAGGLTCFGRTSSGKTSGMKGIALSILAYGNSSMLVLCSKRNEYKDWLAMAAEVGRSKDVVVVHPSSAVRFNMVGHEATRQGEGGGQVASVVRFIMELRNVVLRQAEGTGGDSEFWRKQDEILIQHTVTVLMLAGQAVTPMNIHSLIMSAPETPAKLGNEAWQAGYCNKCLAAGFDRLQTNVQKHDYQLAADYFLKLWPQMADRTKGSILTGTIGTLTAMNTGMARELFASETNMTPGQMIEGRRIAIVSMPPDEYGDLGLIANIGMKWHWQNEVLRRDANADSPVACIWGDESSLWATPSDAKFLSRCRSYRGCMVYLCQSLNSYKEAIPGEKAEAATEAMLSNFSHKLFFSLGDHATAEYASNLVGKELQQFGGGSVQHPDSLFSLGHEQRHSSSFNEHYESRLQTSAFLTGLRTGSPVNDYIVDAILVRSGQPFSNGLPYLNVSFDQRK